MSWNRKAVGGPADVAKEIARHDDVPQPIKDALWGVAGSVKPEVGLYVETEGHIDSFSLYGRALLRIEVVPLAKAGGDA